MTFCLCLPPLAGKLLEAWPGPSQGPRECTVSAWRVHSERWAVLSTRVGARQNEKGSLREGQEWED